MLCLGIQRPETPAAVALVWALRFYNHCLCRIGLGGQFCSQGQPGIAAADNGNIYISRHRPAPLNVGAARFYGLVQRPEADAAGC